jgi:hypothetical protein
MVRHSGGCSMVKCDAGILKLPKPIFYEGFFLNNKMHVSHLVRDFFHLVRTLILEAFRSPRTKYCNNLIDLSPKIV